MQSSVRPAISPARTPFEMRPASSAAHAVLLTLDRHCAAAHAAQAADLDECAAVFKRFEASPARTPRTDGVPGDMIGPQSYGRSPDDYILDCQAARGAMLDVLGGPNNLLQRTLRELQVLARKRGYTDVRPLRHKGQDAITGRVMRWTVVPGDRQSLLKPHEDASQLHHRINADSEFFSVDPDSVVALNIYANVQPGTGALILHDAQPTAAERLRLGAPEFGYPYERDWFAGAQRLPIELCTGDACAIRGAVIHEVETGAFPTYDRLVINLFFARLDDETIIWFT